MNHFPIIKDVLLVGGGHSHVLLIRSWAMQPIPGVRLTLVSEKVNTPYSGMLPGLIAGHYSEEDIHIDLARLCSWANVRFIEQRIMAINPDEKIVSLGAARPALEFDVLSLDTGSTPQLNVSGSDQFSVPVKPVHSFFGRWQSLKAKLLLNASTGEQSQALSVGVVGSGAGGFELITAIRYALSDDVATCHWIIRGSRALKGRPEKVSDQALQAANDAGVVVHMGFDVVAVLADQVQARDGRTVALDEIVWCAAARAPDWPREAGFDVDERGFVLTNEYLQSLSHNYVFATGDIGTQRDTPSDKAGVFAVRQAPVLLQNIKRYLLNKKLRAYRPQTDFLSLMAIGKKSAIGARGAVCLQGGWVWRIKDMIDQKFMNQFRLLPEMKLDRSPFKLPHALLVASSVSAEDVAGVHMRCRGCGGKVGATILDSVLHAVNSYQSSSVVSGLDDAADAAIFNTNGKNVVQSVDQITALCDDPYVFGRIAAVHALSDIYSSGASAQSAQVMVNIPFADHRIVRRDLHQLMSGVVDALNDDQCALIGGHTSESNDLSLGFVVNGLVEQNEHTVTVEAGDLLVLTKSLGTGVLLAGMMKQKAKGSDVAGVLLGMQKSNRIASELMRKHGVNAMTDVTGFGLLGHLQRLLHSVSDDSQGSLSYGADIDIQKIATYSGAYPLASQGVTSTLLSQNQHVLNKIEYSNDVNNAWLNLLCDPQTSGGLLGIVSAERSDALMANLLDQGCKSAQIIGTISTRSTIQLQP